ncbi:MAG TPA: hypothetical protein VM942_11535 [Acidimicrobiales bacterium]|nr:hypothetical protein [Acidimicrobiales bacterium]
MSNWGDGLSEVAKTEMDKVLTAAVTFAETMLEGQGAFYPYAVKLTDTGETEMATVPAGSEDALATLVEGLVAQRFALRSTAVVAAVHLESIGSDAVRVDLEHREGAALTLIRPYTRKRLRKKIEWGEMQSMVVDPRVWGD